ncbi:MAG: histidinol-phosphate transaminase [Crocinitomicaceae bacterium]|nr:histidinol-phosphate transaminase [Flavobacteriales bacterium]NQZ34711.1 histidinol-phosphate transaminase [Crocinitomicaceae bacterium]
MFDLEKLVRPNILKLSPYSSARDEFMGQASIYLDANENPYGNLNRYPDPYQRELKQLLSERNKITTDRIFIGNGSDEIIDLLFRLFAQPGINKALTFSPTYGMYRVSAEINDVELIEIPLDENFQIDLNTTLPFLDDSNVKLIFICSPNNPTGNLLRSSEIEEIINRFSGIVVIDEAYIDFADAQSWNTRLSEFPNLIVTQTFSKARGLAAARLGIAYSNSEIVSLLNKLKPPYNVSSLNQQAGIESLKNESKVAEQIQRITSERTRLLKELSALAIVQRIYPTDANFILLEMENANDVYLKLTQKGIVVRNRSKLIPNTLRISIGTENENNILLTELNQLQS